MHQVQSQWTQDSTTNDIMNVREREVAERIREKSGTFTIRQMASIHNMSIPFMKGFAARHGIHFKEGSRTKRLSSVVIDLERRHTSTVVARSISRKPVTSIDSEKITRELRELAKRRDRESSNSFVEMLRDLSKTHTREQAAKAAGISPTFMRSMAYNQQLIFVGEFSPTNGPATPTLIGKLKSSLFRPSKAVPMATSRMIRQFVICDIEDQI
ncbi:hypothetical protein [Pseudomonas syringae]|uniref:hypothetical protein n=1 Tax=Pseudomonas syringae TaxID=317 RepID=UPI001F31F875|nr:hypothetical protein [Pseudomonas syringae]MCF5371240.1 hypothetical protein [Pseudomonas syringae]MCF5381909.1 hypothetical protein [Pseudomonas syringae]MCF5424041.1 hypothetical protein [Pseudomonas syringae]MCF5454924.1 hypothetical protein [Pseudomonas syringae]MCF5459252.1 hypothetical protein [Pseudomonas syringae]